MKKILFFVFMFLLTNGNSQPPKKPITNTTKKLWYWKGTYITKKQCQDSIGAAYLKFCDSLKKSKYVN